MSLNLIFASSINGVIGQNNQLPWHLPEDLAHFKALTLGHVVLMGRKTWESIPQQFRPLPGRTNWVLSRQVDWTDSGARSFTSLQEAQQTFELEYPQGQLWVIGGAEIYNQAIDHASRIELTLVEKTCTGEALAPKIDSNWVTMSKETHTAKNGLVYHFISYQRHPKE
jgi:dihydrofolate reductase